MDGTITHRKDDTLVYPSVELTYGRCNKTKRRNKTKEVPRPNRKREGDSTTEKSRLVNLMSVTGRTSSDMDDVM